MKKVKLQKQKIISYFWTCPKCGIEVDEDAEYIQSCPDDSLISECLNCGCEVEIIKTIERKV